MCCLGSDQSIAIEVGSLLGLTVINDYLGRAWRNDYPVDSRNLKDLAMIKFLLLYIATLTLPYLNKLAWAADDFSAKKENFIQLFNQVPIKSIDGVPYEGAPVSLDYKEFINPMAKGTIIIVHGFSENFFRYRELIYDFYHMGYSVYIYNQRGHGASHLIKEPSVFTDNFDHYVTDLQLIVKNAVKNQQSMPIILFGHSMGGGVSARFMEKYPGLVNGAVLASPMIKVNTGGLPEWLARVAAQLGVWFGFSENLAPGHNLPDPEPWSFDIAGTKSKERYKDDIEVAYRDDIRTWIRGGATFAFVSESMKNSDLLLSKDELAKIKRPILVLQAGDDAWVDNEGQDEFCQAIAEYCKLVRFPKSMHTIHKQVDAIRNRELKVIKEFFEDVRSKSVASFH